MKRFFLMASVLGVIVLAQTGVQAQVVWTDWTSGTEGATGSATGSLHVEGADVAVAYTGEVAFIQTDGGTDYWNPSDPYISPTVPNAPPTPDIIALSLATSKTITFSQPITNPLFAVVSLNGNGYRFDRDFDILSYGTGYWGNGTLTKKALAGGLFELDGEGEPHGVIEFQGTYSSISWTSLTDEYWNGFTIGVRGLAPSVVPEAGTGTLLIASIGLMGAILLPTWLSQSGYYIGKQRNRPNRSTGGLSKT